LPDGIENVQIETTSSTMISHNSNDEEVDNFDSPKQNVKSIHNIIDLAPSKGATPKKPEAGPSRKKNRRRRIIDDDSEDEALPQANQVIQDDDDDIFNVKLIDESKAKQKKAAQVVIDCNSESESEESEEEDASSYESHEEDSFIDDECSDEEVEKENIRPTNTVAQLSGKDFIKQRDKLMVQFYNDINKTVFANKLPRMEFLPESEIKGGKVRQPYLAWNKHLRTTAGITRCFVRSLKSGATEYVAAIELSTKVIDDVHRMRKTLAHEICHVAAFCLDHVRGHGKTFFKYGEMVSRAFKDIGTVTTCHNYDIYYKFIYECVKCGQKIKRQSKSINIDAQGCGVMNCGGKFQLLRQQKSKDGKTELVTPKTPSKYNIFMSENYARIIR
jgi:predicted SprT family Zn-dependent metalloprotease